ncbi:hypothetical protein P7H00_01330 [Enterococcus pseudoavium]|uniref:Uncharacterized protein n=1 Tax=Enterococcus pseudoavium TaxID=44007 RepID=A0AAE4HZV3_9ENTE|nr:hypothetical protein [Enterococcus pseudoavium]MDT2735772.1 hypothetical protein [Enterococcus pseudoavium]
MDIYSIQQIAFAGLICTALLLLIALFTKLTNGLFIARFPFEFLKDMNDPRYENEKRFGNRFRIFIFKYIPPFFIGFAIILFLTYLV